MEGVLTMDKYKIKGIKESIKFFDTNKQLYYFDENNCRFYKVIQLLDIEENWAHIIIEDGKRVFVWIKRLMTLKDMKKFIHSERFKNIQTLQVKRVSEELRRLMEFNDDTI